MEITKGSDKIDWKKGEIFFFTYYISHILTGISHLILLKKLSTFFTVILKSSMERSVSQIFDVGLSSLFMLCRRKVNIIFYIFFLFT